MAFFVVVPAAATYFGAASLGASIAGAIGLTGLSTAATFAIGAGTISAGFTALKGGNPKDILKSAVLGGVTSYIGGTVGADIASNVRADAIMNGNLSFDIADAIGKVAGSAAAGSLSGGASSLITGKGDPIQALIKGGISSAMSTAVSTGIDAALKDVPGFGTPTNAGEAALQRAMKTAIGTTILSGGDPDKIKSAVLNSFASTAGRYLGGQLKDLSSDVSSANDAFRASEREYTNNLEQQQKLADQFNSAAAPLQDLYAKIEPLNTQYETVANNFNNYDSWMTSQGYKKTPIVVAYDDGGNPIFSGEEWINIPASLSKEALYNQAKALEAQTKPLVDQFNAKNTELFGGEVTKYRTETHYRTEGGWDENGYYERQVPVEVQVPYTEKVEGSLTPVKQQFDTLKNQSTDLEKNYLANKDALTNAVSSFQNAELNNAGIVGKTLNNYVAANNQYRDKFGVDLTEDQINNFAATGDLLGAVNKVIADSESEKAAKESIQQLPVTPAPAPAPVSAPAPAPVEIPAPATVPDVVEELKQAGLKETEPVVEPELIPEPVLAPEPASVPEPAPAPAPIGTTTVPGEDGSQLIVDQEGNLVDIISPETPSETPAVPPFQGPMGPPTEDIAKRYSDEFAKYLDYLQAGQPAPPEYEPPPFNEPGPYWEEFDQNLKQMMDEGRLPSQWQQDDEGNYTFVSDDGSTITIGPEGNIVHYTEAPVGNLPGEELPVPATSAGGGAGKPPAPAPAPAPAPVPSPAPAPAAQSGTDIGSLLGLLGMLGGSQAQPQLPEVKYAQMPEFDITKAFSPTLYEEQQKADQEDTNKYLRGLIGKG